MWRRTEMSRMWSGVRLQLEHSYRKNESVCLVQDECDEEVDAPETILG